MSDNSATVHLRATDDNLNSILDKARNTVESFGSKVNSTLSSLANFSLVAGMFNDIASSISDLSSRLMSLGAESIEFHEEQIAAERRLGAVHKATAEAVGLSVDQLKEMAVAMQEVTNIGDEVYISNMAIMSSFRNIRGDQFKEAIMLAADMATVLDQTDMKSATTQIAKALNNPIEGMTYLRKAGVSFTEQQKIMIKTLVESGKGLEAQKIVLSELRSEYGGAAKAVMTPFKQLKNAIGDFKENMGEALLPVVEHWKEGMKVIVTASKNVIPTIHTMVESVMHFGEVVGKKLTPYFQSFSDMVVNIFSAGQVIVGNFQQVSEVALLTFRLDVIKVFESVNYFFGSVIPDVMRWFTSEWINIFKDIANATRVITSNMFDNLESFFGSVKDFLWTGKADWKWEALTKGFESSLTELPEIAARHKSDLESIMEGQLENLSKPLTDKWKASFEANKKAFSSWFKDTQKANIDPQGNPSDYYDFGTKSKKDAKDKLAKAVTHKVNVEISKGFTANFEDVMGVNKRIQEAAASRPKDDTLKRLLEVQEHIRKNLDTWYQDFSAHWPVSIILKTLSKVSNTFTFYYRMATTLGPQAAVKHGAKAAMAAVMPTVNQMTHGAVQGMYAGLDWLGRAAKGKPTPSRLGIPPAPSAEEREKLDAATKAKEEEERDNADREAFYSDARSRGAIPNNPAFPRSGGATKAPSRGPIFTPRVTPIGGTETTGGRRNSAGNRILESFLEMAKLMPFGKSSSKFSPSTFFKGIMDVIPMPAARTKTIGPSELEKKMREDIKAAEERKKVKTATEKSAIHLKKISQHIAKVGALV